MAIRAVLGLVFLLSVTASAASPDYGSLPLFFEANRGQAPAGVLFVARGRGYELMFTQDAITVLQQGGTMRLVPLAPAGRLRAEEPLDTHVNYILGQDAGRWALDVPVFARLVRELHPGIQVQYYSRDGSLEFDYVVAPGADPAQIRLRSEDATPRLKENGDLTLQGSGTEMLLRAPRLYQVTPAGAKAVAGRYKVQGDEVSFEVGEYDRALPLVIDPELVYASYLGKSGWEAARGIAVSSTGHAHITGMTISSDFPTAHTSDGYGADAFIVKLDPTGSRLIYATYFGGSGDDRAHAIALDSAGNAYITGGTASIDLPVSSAALQKELRSVDAFVAKFGPTGVLQYATYIGGTMSEYGMGIAVSQAGEAYITGYTNSSDYPTTPAAFQTACVGCGGFLGYADAFVTRLNANGSGMVYSTYLSGNIFDYGQGIAVDSAGNAVVVGFTASDHFPTVNPIQASRKGYQGRSDAFVSKFNPTGSALIYSTYLGSFQDDFGYGVAVDISGNAYVVGESQWSDFPTTPGSYLPSAVIAGFLTKISPMGQLVYSTRVQAGGYAPVARSVAVNSTGEAFITGNARDQGSWTPFVQRFSTNGSALIYSQLIGGISLDEGYGIAVDGASNAYITGQTFSADFPTTTGVVQPSCGKEQFNTCTSDGFVARVGPLAGAPLPPGTPTAVLAAGLSRSQIGISWAASAGAVDGYKIERCTGSASACAYSLGFLPIATVTGTTVQFVDVRLPAGMTYTYRVQAFNAGGISAYSNMDDATTLAYSRQMPRLSDDVESTTTDPQRTIKATRRKR